MPTSENSSEKDAMFKGHITIPIKWLAAFMTAGLLHTGVMYQQFQTLREDSIKVAAMVIVLRENQVRNMNDVSHIVQEVTSHDARLTVLEKSVLDIAMGKANQR